MNEQQSIRAQESVARHLAELTAERQSYSVYPSEQSGIPKRNSSRVVSTTLPPVQYTASNNGPNPRNDTPYQEESAAPLYTANTLANRRNILRVRSSSSPSRTLSLRNFVRTTSVPSKSIEGIPRAARTLRREAKIAESTLREQQAAFEAATAAQAKANKNAENAEKFRKEYEREEEAAKRSLRFNGGKRTKRKHKRN